VTRIEHILLIRARFSRCEIRGPSTASAVLLTVVERVRAAVRPVCWCIEPCARSAASLPCMVQDDDRQCVALANTVP